MHIHSPQNERIKKAVRLRDRRGRQQQGRIIIDGIREVTRALDSGIEPLEAFVCESDFELPELVSVAEQLGKLGTVPAVVAPNVFAKLAFGNRSEGIVLVARQPRCELQQLELPADALVCVLEGIEKPGNVGAVIRTADAAGVAAVVVADGVTDLYNPNAIRASLGAVFRVPVCAGPSRDVLTWLLEQHFAIFAARVDGAVDYTRVDYRGKSALVLGSEASGLSDTWTGPSVTPVSLPMLGIGDSLNVSATAAVLCYESLRQRRA
jgi:TrmH family RNA methyltransferase